MVNGVFAKMLMSQSVPAASAKTPMPEAFAVLETRDAPRAKARRNRRMTHLQGGITAVTSVSIASGSSGFGLGHPRELLRAFMAISNVIRFRPPVGGTMTRRACLLSLWVLLLACVACDDDSQTPSASYPDCIEQPSAQSPPSGGCSNVFVAQQLDASRMVTVSVDQRMVRLTTSCTTFDLSISNPGVGASLAIAPGDPLNSFNFCNDVLPPNFVPPDYWHATSGTLTIVASEDDPPASDHAFRVTVKLTDVHFIDPRTQNEVQIPVLVFWDVYVGSAPGYQRRAEGD